MKTVLFCKIFTYYEIISYFEEMVLTFYLKMHCDIFFLWPIHWLIMFLFLNINVLCGFFSVFFHPCPCPCNDDNTSLLLLKAAEGFLFVVSCDRARILYVSESVRNILNYTRVNINWHKVVNHSLLDSNNYVPSLQTVHGNTWL